MQEKLASVSRQEYLWYQFLLLVVYPWFAWWATSVTFLGIQFADSELWNMWIEKIRRGVLQVETDGELRFVEPSFAQRIQLLWTFRNFNVLPEHVLNQHERQLIGQLCQRSRPVRRGVDTAMPGPIIGILELNKSVASRKKAPQSTIAQTRNSA